MSGSASVLEVSRSAIRARLPLRAPAPGIVVGMTVSGGGARSRPADERMPHMQIGQRAIR